MPYLSFISDDDFLLSLHKVLQAGQDKREKSDATFYKNVIDPFGPIFETTINGFSADDWKKSEKGRQLQKTMQNAIGEFHNDILGSVKGWHRLDKGGQIDLTNDSNTVIAEIKNKYNTVSGGKLNTTYEELQKLIRPKASKYHGATAYFVQIILKKPEPFDRCFTPSNKAEGQKMTADENIREIDGKSFYAMVTGINDALDQLHSKLPMTIQELNDFDHSFDANDIATFADFFKRTYNKTMRE